MNYVSLVSLKLNIILLLIVLYFFSNIEKLLLSSFVHWWFLNFIFTITVSDVFLKFRVSVYYILPILPCLSCSLPKIQYCVFCSQFVFFPCFSFQLDICQKMASYLARAASPFALWYLESVCMDGCYFSSCGAYFLGMVVDCNIGSRYNWVGCNNGWYCSSFGILFNHALVENTMAELKYVFCWPFYCWTN